MLRSLVLATSLGLYFCAGSSGSSFVADKTTPAEKTATKTAAKNSADDKAAAETKPATKRKDVKLGDITLSIPSTWTQQEPSNNLRLGQFSIPAAKGDKDAVELTVFNFGANSIGDNINRWVNQFKAEGRNVKVTRGKSKQGLYAFVDISGTYNAPIGPPIRMQTKPMPNARMLGVILLVEDKGVYFLKVAGAEKTIAAAVDDLRAAFGGDAKAEVELKPKQPEQPKPNDE